MKLKPLLLTLLLLVAIGLGVVLLNERGAGSHDVEPLNIEYEISDPLPEIDFQMLDEVRPLSLIDDGHVFPDSLKELDGRRVSMIGFMAPYDSLTDMRRCMMVPTYVGCNFCSPPNLTQVVYVTQGSDDESSRTYPFIEEPSYVTGTLRLSLPGREHEGMEQGYIYSIENAVVTAHHGGTPKLASDHGTAPHKPKTDDLDPVEIADLIQQVADIAGREPLGPIEIEPVSEEEFARQVRAGLEIEFPEEDRAARTRAFQFFGILPDNTEWIDNTSYFQLLWSVAATDEIGHRIYILDSLPINHPYVRLELVGEITDAILRQHEHRVSAEQGTTTAPQASIRNDDARRAHVSLRRGIKAITTYRYAIALGISLTTQPPSSFIQIRRASESYEFRVWDSLPRYIGSFFVRSIVGDTRPLADVGPALARPPSSTMEFFRPQWYGDDTLWRQDPVAEDFADNILDYTPTSTDVLGVSGIVPLLSNWHSFEVAKTIAGGWVGDRWAIWLLPEDAAALILETRWQDEESAVHFRKAMPKSALWRLTPHQPGSTRVHLLRADSIETLDRLTEAVQAETAPEGTAAVIPN